MVSVYTKEGCGVYPENNAEERTAKQRINARFMNTVREDLKVVIKEDAEDRARSI